MSSMSAISQTEVKNEDAKKLDTEITPQKDSKTVTVPPESPLAEVLPPDDLNTSNGESVFLKLPKSELEKLEWKKLLASYTTKDDTIKSNAVCSEAAKPTLEPVQQTVPQSTIQYVQQPAIQQQQSDVPWLMAPVAPLAQMPIKPPMYYSAPTYYSGGEEIIVDTLLQPRNNP